MSPARVLGVGLLLTVAYLGPPSKSEEAERAAEAKIPAISAHTASADPKARLAAIEAWKLRFGKVYTGSVIGLNEEIVDDDLRLVATIEGQRKIEPTYTFSLTLRQRPITDAGLEHLHDFGFVQQIDLSGSRVSDNGMAHLATCRNLVQLNLRDTAITDRGLAHLSACARLEELNLTNTRITDQGLASIAKLPRLVRIYLTGTTISDAGLAQLGSMKSLTYLHLNDTAVTGKGVALLPQRAKLLVTLSAKKPPADMPWDKFKDVSADVAYPLADFAAETFAGEQIRIRSGEHYTYITIVGHGNFTWHEPLTSELLRNWLGRYKIVALQLSDCSWLDDATLTQLQANHGLQELVVQGRMGQANKSSLSDVAFARLCQSEQVEKICVPSVDLSATGLSTLKYCPNLTTLCIYGGQIHSIPNDKFDGSRLTTIVLHDVKLPRGLLTWLAKNSPSVQTLSIDGSKINGGELTGFKQLSGLSVCKAGLTDADLVNLQGMNKLQSIDVSGNPITGDGFAALAGLKSVSCLTATNTKVQAAGLEHLGQLSALSYLNCQDSPLSDEEAQKLANRFRWTFQGACSCGCMDINPEDP